MHSHKIKIIAATEVRNGLAIYPGSRLMGCCFSVGSTPCAVHPGPPALTTFRTVLWDAFRMAADLTSYLWCRAHGGGLREPGQIVEGQGHAHAVGLEGRYNL